MKYEVWTLPDDSWYRFKCDADNVVIMRLRKCVHLYEDQLRINKILAFVFTATNDETWWIGADPGESQSSPPFELIGPFSDHEQAIIHAKLIQDGD